MASAHTRPAVCGALAAAAGLVVTAPSPVRSVGMLAGAEPAVVVTDPLLAVVALLAWCCAAYLLLLAALTAGSRLPGVGPAAAAAVRRAAPPGLQRALALTLGASLVVGTLGPGTAAAAGSLPGPALTAQTAPPSGVPAPVVAPLPGATPPLDHPVQPVRRSRVPDRPSDVVVVRPGDSLWSLAERHLAQQGASTSDARVAQAWPSWWRANRAAIGDDPDLLLPGTALAPPTGS